MKRLAIVRMRGHPIDPQTYNVQEIGFAKALHHWEVDIYSRITDAYRDREISLLQSRRWRIREINGVIAPGYQVIDFSILTKLKNGNYNVIQVHELDTLMLPFIIWAMRNTSVKIIVWNGIYRNYSSFGYYIQFIYEKLIYPYLKEKISHIFCKTKQSKEFVKSKGFDRLSVLPIGLDVDNLITKASLPTDFTQFLSNGNHSLLYIGTIEKRRNPNFLIDILELLKHQGEKVNLLIIGSGPNQEELKSYIKLKKLNTSVLFQREVQQSNINKLLSCVDLVLLPTHYEIFGMIILEALSSGVPVISSAEAGPTEIIQDRVLGEIVGWSVIDWVNAIKRQLEYSNDNDKEYRKNHIHKRYSWISIAKRYNKKIESL